MKQSAKTALGGIISALSLALMLISAVVPFMEYALPAMAGALMIIMVVEVGKKWAVVAYVSVSILSLIILTNKETAMMYIAFFGYYPIFKPVVEAHIRAVPLRWLIKAVEFNAAVIGAYFFLVKVFGMPVEELTEHGLPGLLLLLAAANVMFVIYDICITRMVILYLNRWQSKFRHVFK